MFIISPLLLPYILKKQPDIFYYENCFEISAAHLNRNRINLVRRHDKANCIS